MKKKITGILICMLLIATVFSNTTTAKNITMFKENTADDIDSSSSKDVSIEEIRKQILDFEPEPAKPPIDDLPKIPRRQIGMHPLEYKPPWDSHFWDIEEYEYGLCDVWQVGTTTPPNYGLTEMHTWAGPGVGVAHIIIWLCHGFYFLAPVAGTYTFEFTYSIEGHLHGEQLGTAMASSQVWILCLVGDEVTEERIIFHEAVGVISGYTDDFDETKTYTMNVDLTKGVEYYVGAQSILRDDTVGALASYALTESRTTGNHARLEKVVIDGPDFEMKDIWMSSQPNDADKNYEVPNPSPGQPVYFHFRYELHGSGIYPPYRREVRLDGNVFCSRNNVTTANEGGHTYCVWCLDPWMATKGRHTIEAEVDVYNQVSELDEDNNELDCEFTVGEDLNAHGTLIWNMIKPGATVSKEFYVENIGSPNSELNWEITEWPDWGTWTFSPKSGNGLKPEDGPFAVHLSIVAPDRQEYKYIGRIKIENTGDSDDHIYLIVTLRTPKNKQSMLLSQFLERLMDRFPIFKWILVSCPAFNRVLIPR